MQIKEGLANIAQENGVLIRTRARVKKIEVEEVPLSDAQHLAEGDFYVFC